MLICRKGDWRLESDGHLSSAELRGLDGLRKVEACRAQDAERETAYLADRVRALKRRAWRRGYEDGRRAALYEFVAPQAALLFASRRLEGRLAELVLTTVAEILGELPSDLVLRGRLRRCLDASYAQKVLSVRVSTEDYEETQRSVRMLERQLNTSVFTVLADAGLPPRSLVVETEGGVIDGSLMPQLRALEYATSDAIRSLLDEYRYIDDESARQLRVIENGLCDVIATLAQPQPQPQQIEERDDREAK